MTSRFFPLIQGLTVLHFFARCALAKALQELPLHRSCCSLLCTLAPKHHLLETSYRLHIAALAGSFYRSSKRVECSGVALQRKAATKGRLKLLHVNCMHTRLTVPSAVAEGVNGVCDCSPG